MSPRPAQPISTPAAADTSRLADAPVLSGLCALAAWSGTLTNHVLLPSLLASGERDAALLAERVGDYLVNLATICGLTALGAGLVVLMRDARWVGLQRRLVVAMFAGILLPSIAVATFFERERTTTELVLFALGAAQVLSVMLSTSAARLTDERGARLLTLAVATAALCALTAQLFELMARQSLLAWQEQARALANQVGEGAYLIGLMVSPFVLTPVADTPRDRWARRLGMVTLCAAAGVFHVFSDALSRDYAVTLYHVQHVSLFIENLPALYAIPVGAALASGTAALLGSEVARRQAGLAMLLWLGTGFAPRAPDRLLTGTLAALLLLRAAAARAAVSAAPPAMSEPSTAAPAPTPIDP